VRGYGDARNGAERCKDKGQDMPVQRGYCANSRDALTAYEPRTNEERVYSQLLRKVHSVQ
jgi:hypothetical protein